MLFKTSLYMLCSDGEIYWCWTFMSYEAGTLVDWYGTKLNFVCSNSYKPSVPSLTVIYGAVWFVDTDGW